MTTRLLPEWHPAEAIVLAWPAAHTDWAPWLDDAQNTYVNLITAINNAGAGVLLLCRHQDISAVKQRIPADARVLLIPAQYNDTWARDYAFLTCSDGQKHYPVEFVFNGWGQKFDASLDNQVNQTYLANLCREKLTSIDCVCEGGALEIDAAGHLLSTTLCLTNPLRNGELSKADYATLFIDSLGVSKTTLLDEGHLEGDDTDGHIDTLARFTPTNGLVVQSAYNRPEDSHFAGLSALVEECRKCLPEHEIFELPLPAMFNTDQERLPASYANFLICNDTVLCPVYGQPEDDIAIAIITSAYPRYQIVAVDCAVLVQQFGSLHCVTMQIPKGTLRDAVIDQLNRGVSEYAR
ncbi:agmatine deiminase family protein [Alteromonas sp. ASW11-36]|uniref:Agmatine deiminase family protein n=1 Tax=Alteromonas arenosi TaxID=3055817 RepID=A0ABT7SS46_9ALTE|nr:agmatine deiminase family protein [Alteromonas sp. ASW11-36]MDM7859015.1 agmatine deiminase family protein [Alteromonas sp. ASW11-36]